MEYRLDKIVFINYKGYEKEQTFNFVTESRYQNDKSSQTKVWDKTTKRKTRYKKVIGIWGKNSSGKSSILELVSVWKSYFYKKNKQYFERLKMKNDSLEGLEYKDVLKYVHKKNSESNSIESGEDEFDDFTNLNNPNEPLFIKLFFSTDLYKIKHTLKFENDSVYKYSSENITIYKDEKKVFDLDINGKDSLYNIIVANDFFQQAIKSKNNKENKLDEFLKTIANLENAKEKFDLFLDENQMKMIKHAWHVFLDFYKGTEIIGLNNQYVLKPSIDIFMLNDKIQSINIWLKKIHDNKKMSIESIKNLLLLLIKNIDSNISDVEICINKKENGNYNIFFKSIINYNGVKNFPNELSLGTIVYIELMLRILYFSKLSNHKKTRYIFIDELGLNWHTNLTKEFIYRICNGLLGENTFLIFTSHDAFAGDDLNNDSIYIINNEQKLIRISDLPNRNGNKPRKNEKFSLNYLNEVLDLYSTTPYFNFFDQIEEMLEDIDGK